MRSRRNYGVIRSLPDSHPYVQQEAGEIRLQIKNEGLLVGHPSHFALWKKIVTISSNRHRIALGLTLMLLQQMMGVNAINYCEHVPSSQLSLPLMSHRLSTIFQNLGLRARATVIRHLHLRRRQGRLITYLCPLFLAGTLGRRKSLIGPRSSKPRPSSTLVFHESPRSSLVPGGKRRQVKLPSTQVKVAHPAIGDKVTPAGYIAVIWYILANLAKVVLIGFPQHLPLHRGLRGRMGVGALDLQR